MRNFKKFLTLVLAVMMVVSSFAFSASAATTKFEDIDADNETLVEAVDLLAYMGVAKGTSETSFGADQNVTREQFALFMYRLMNGGKDAPKASAHNTGFTDLEDPTYFYAIAWAKAEGIITGRTATTFDPKGGITLQEAYTMIVRALDWNEEGNLIYPFGFITVAEQDGVELDDGLDSSVGYADVLTRADMAILLYNAFFAETGVEEVKTRERKIGGDDDNATWVLEEYTTNPRLCEKKFDVIEVEYQIIATPYYTVAGEEATYDLGYEAVYAYMNEDSDVNADAGDAPDYVYFTAEELGLAEGTLDAYFLGYFTTFVTLDEDDDIEKVLFADCNMTKKNVTEIALGEVSFNKEASYFANTDAKLLSGKMTAGEDVFYAFNAPYSYAEPRYDAVSSAFDKFALRNAENVEGFYFTMENDGDVDYYVANVYDITPVQEEDYYDDEDGKFNNSFSFAAEAETLAEMFSNIYNDGYYEADLYDVDGDGLMDYIYYKPYTVFQVDSDEEEYFEDSDFDAEDNDVPYIYTNEATVIGEDFADEDFVIGYFSEELATVKVAAVVKPTLETVANYKKATGVLTLGNGDKIDAVSSAWKLGATEPKYDVEDAIETAVTGNPFFAKDILDEEEMEFYVYDGVLVYATTPDANVKFTENLIIPTTLNGEKDVKYVFNAEAGEDTLYIYAWVDGTTKYVPVEVEDIYPSIEDDFANYYENKLCTYTIDADGIYTIKSLGYAENEDGDYKGVAKLGETDNNGVDYTVESVLGNSDEEGKEDAQFYFEVNGPEADDEDPATITKVAGSRFDVGFDRNVDLKAYTKIIIRVYDAEEDEYEYVVYDASSFKKSVDEEVELYNMSMIVSNNADSTKRENLVVLYAETNDFDFKGTADTDGYRIVSGYDIGEDEAGDWRVYYELYNPFTGAKETDVPSKDSADKANRLNPIETKGQIIELQDGMVDEDEVIVNQISTDNLVWIAEVDAAEGYIKAIPYVDVASKDAAEVEVEDYDYENDAHAKDIYGVDLPTEYIDVDKNTVISVIKYSDLDYIWEWGTMAAVTFDELAAAKNEILSYNNKSFDRNGNYKTTYADYVKAYVAVVDENIDEDENAKADFIIIVVNGEEGSAFEDNRRVEE